MCKKTGNQSSQHGFKTDFLTSLISFYDKVTHLAEEERQWMCIPGLLWSLWHSPEETGYSWLERLYCSLSENLTWYRMELHPADVWSQIFQSVHQWSVLGTSSYVPIFLSMIWMRGWSALSVSLQVPTSWAGVLICRGIWTLYQWVEAMWKKKANNKENFHVLPFVTVTPGSAIGWGRVAGKLPGRKGPWGIGWQQLNRSQEGQGYPGLYRQ